MYAFLEQDIISRFDEIPDSFVPAEILRNISDQQFIDDGAANCGTIPSNLNRSIGVDSGAGRRLLLGPEDAKSNNFVPLVQQSNATYQKNLNIFGIGDPVLGEINEEARMDLLREQRELEDSIAELEQDGEKVLPEMRIRLQQIRSKLGIGQ